jgi:uncharacterized protein
MSPRGRTRPTLAVIKSKREEIIRLAERYGASNVRVFGSVARGDAIEMSDVDLLVDMQTEPDGLAYFGRLGDLKRGISDLLGYDVNVVDSESIDRIRERVMRDAVPL